MNSEEMAAIKGFISTAVSQAFENNKMELVYKVAEQVWTTRNFDHLECPEHLKQYAINSAMIRAEMIATIALVDKLKNLPLQEHITALKEIMKQDPDLRQYIQAQL